MRLREKMNMYLLLFTLATASCSVILVRWGSDISSAEVLLTMKGMYDAFGLPTYTLGGEPLEPIASLNEDLALELDKNVVNVKDFDVDGDRYSVITSKNGKLGNSSIKCFDHGWFPVQAYLNGKIPSSKFPNGFLPVDATVKNSSTDPKISQYLRSLISGEINASPDIYDLRTFIFRFGAYGEVQYIYNEGDGDVIVLDGSDMIVDLQRECVEAQIGEELFRFCRASQKLDGELTDFIDGHKNLKWVPFTGTKYHKALKSAGVLEKVLTENMVNFKTPPISKKSQHGMQRLVAVLRATGKFIDECTISSELKTAAEKAARETVRMTFDPKISPPKCTTTKYSIIDKDTFAAAVQHIDSHQKDRVMVVNFANNYRPGGGYMNGASAQEEDLFRCSTLPWSLGTLGKTNLYPVNDSTSANALFTPQCHILRDRTGYKFYDERQIKNYNVSVCSIAAFNVNDQEEKSAFTTFGKNQFSPSGAELTLNRIRMMFQMATLKDADVLIVGAFGCGVFRNDPEVIIGMFNQVMKEYDGAIKHVQFAIIGANLEIFRKGISFPVQKSSTTRKSLDKDEPEPVTTQTSQSKETPALPKKEETAAPPKKDETPALPKKEEIAAPPKKDETPALPKKDGTPEPPSKKNPAPTSKKNPAPPSKETPAPPKKEESSAPGSAISSFASVWLLIVVSFAILN